MSRKEPIGWKHGYKREPDPREETLDKHFPHSKYRSKDSVQYAENCIIDFREIGGPWDCRRASTNLRGDGKSFAHS